MTSFADAVRPWHDFAMLLGTAAATLVGLLFVAATVATGFFTEEKSPAFRAFVSPSVVHFSAVLAACLMFVAPLSGWLPLGCLLGVEGLLGIVYCGLVWRSMVRAGISASIDLEDRLMYAALPAVCYAAMLAAGVVLAQGAHFGCGVLAGSLGLLLAVGIRNAWDITSWITLRRRN
jgi:hypothetical protein